MRNGLPALAAFGSSFWTAAMQFLAVRFYLERLGVEAYGVIGFFVSLQAMLQILDVGLAPAVNRDLARSKALGTMRQGRVLLRTLGVIYWLNGLLIAAALILLSSGIARSWLNAIRLDTAELAQAIMLMGVVVAVRWPVALYYNALVGLGRLGQASAVNAAMSTVSVLCSIAAITYVHADLQTLFAAQAIVAFATVLVMQRLVWRAIGGAVDARFEWAALSGIWRFSLAMGGVTLTAVALTQLDKVLLSRLLSLEQFGAYMVAASLAAGLLLMVTPLFGIIFPRFSALAATGRQAELRSLYHEGSRLFAVLFLPVALAVGLYGEEIVWAWTGRHDTAVQVAPIVFLLAVGYGINGVMFFPYSLQLALGLSRIPLIINIAMLVVMAPLILLLTTTYGAIGGAAAWPLLQIIYLFVGTIVTHRHSDQGGAMDWIFRSFLLPFATSLLILLALRPLVMRISDEPFAILAGAGSTVMATWLVSAVVRPTVRSSICRALRSNREVLAS